MHSVSRYWAYGLTLTIIIAFSILIFGGQKTYEERPPIPKRVLTEDGRVLFTTRDITGGQAVFQKYGLMDFGSIFGHGAYFGPDFTAQYLHLWGREMKEFHAQDAFDRPYDTLPDELKALIDTRTTEELQANRYDPATGDLTLTAAQVQGYATLKQKFNELFVEGDQIIDLPHNMVSENRSAPGHDRWLSEKPETEQLGNFFAWSAWAAAARRPDRTFSYTNNWPPDASVGNLPPKSAVIWSNAALGIFFLALGLIIFVWKVFELRGGEELHPDGVARITDFEVTPSQVKVVKYFIVVALLFLLQTLVGSLMAHYFVEETAFFGFPVEGLFPFHILRSWHLQLAIFWVATAWLGTGIYLAPLLGGREPRWQGFLVDLLFYAVVIVAVGSLAGEWLGAKGLLGRLWFWLGNQGWEYLELGRLWQILLLAGMLIWVYVVYRALRYRLRKEDGAGSLTHLLLYAALSIPAFYVFGLFYTPATNFTLADFWRWFVVHLWVEGMLEFFAVISISYLFVTLGLVRRSSATRAVYFTLILIFGSGIVGVGHHYFWTGNPGLWLAMGAVFSSVEIVPLVLLVFEAIDQYGLLRRGGKGFDYQWPLLFLVATSVWNFVGAGVLGLITNMPIVSYYEHGTYLTAAHGHGAFMGTYGMLAVGLMLFSLRNLVQPEHWPGKLVSWSFWLLNIGLVSMLIFNLLPVGFLQLADSFNNGFWHARSAFFIRLPLIRALTWARMPGDILFISGAGLLVIALVGSVRHLREATAGR